jgi:hypothetical protein
MDQNGSDEAEDFEYGQLWADADGTPGLQGAIGEGAAIWQFAGSANVEPSFNLLPGDQHAPYLFFEPFDYEFETGTNNDYLVYKVELERDQVIPEPATVSMLGGALLFLASAAIRRRHRSGN